MVVGGLKEDVAVPPLRSLLGHDGRGIDTAFVPCSSRDIKTARQIQQTVPSPHIYLKEEVEIGEEMIGGKVTEEVVAEQVAIVIVATTNPALTTIPYHYLVPDMHTIEALKE